MSHRLPLQKISRLILAGGRSFEDFLVEKLCLTNYKKRRKDMKRLLLIGALLAVLVMSFLPVLVTAEGCCDYEVGSCCWEQCCANQTYWFRVSYFERVSTSYFNRGVEMTTGVWTHQYVEAHDREAAAAQLGFIPGYGCIINRAIGYGG